MPRHFQLKPTIKNLALSLLSIAFTSQAMARWQLPEEAEARIDFFKSRCVIYKSGANKCVSEVTATVQNEAGRSSYGTMRWTYNARTTKKMVLEAYVLVGKKKIPVAKQFIEDKPSASNITGFDQLNLLTIAFPEVAVGATIFYKTETTISEVPFVGHYDDISYFGKDSYDAKIDFEFASEIPLQVKVNDPDSGLIVKNSKIGGRQLIKITSTKPYFKKVVEEKNNTYTARDEYAYVALSSSKTYPAMAKKVIKDYEAVLIAKLPEEFLGIAEAAKKEKDFISTSNKVTSLLADQVRYMADWRSVRGGHVPRPLRTIAKSRFGDCKDMASVTVAILRRLGYKAQVAWIMRANWPVWNPPLPAVEAFNHAIVYVEEGGKSYWIDPTNKESFAQSIRPDLADHMALILDPKNIHTFRTPLPSPEDDAVNLQSTAEFSADGDAKVTYALDMRGNAAASVTGISRYGSKDSIDYSIVKSVAGDSFIKSSKIAPYDFSSRIVTDIKLNVEADLQRMAARSTAGFIYDLKSTTFAPYLAIDPKTSVGGLFLGMPYHRTSTETLVNAELIGEKPADCQLQTKWYSASRKIETTDGNIVVAREITLREPLITNQELISPAFKKFQTEISNCFDDYSLVFKTKSDMKEQAH
jgi:hypothetical protein